MCTGHVRCANGSLAVNGRLRLLRKEIGHRTLSGVHRTVRCAIEQTASTNGHLGGWGYKYPNHPTIHCIQVFQLPTTIQELAFIAKHTNKRSNPLPIPFKTLVTRESDL